MLIDELRCKKKQITSVVHKYGASNIKIFGSVSRGEENVLSDVDIIVSLPKGYDMFRQRIALQEELENIIGRNVDLIIRHEINKHMEAAILNEARDL